MVPLYGGRTININNYSCGIWLVAMDNGYNTTIQLILDHVAPFTPWTRVTVWSMVWSRLEL